MTKPYRRDNSKAVAGIARPDQVAFRRVVTFLKPYRAESLNQYSTVQRPVLMPCLLVSLRVTAPSKYRYQVEFYYPNEFCR